MLVVKPLAGVFADAATQPVRTRSRKLDTDDGVEVAVPGEPRSNTSLLLLPETYVFAGKPDTWGYDHPLPPPPNQYLNAGFFVLRPDARLYEYYAALLRQPKPELIAPQFPEQNLLNFAHREKGRMPWTRLDWRWNMNWPTVRDLEAGARSLHGKFWVREEDGDEVLRELWEAVRWEMVGFWRGVEMAEKGT